MDFPSNSESNDNGPLGPHRFESPPPSNPSNLSLNTTPIVHKKAAQSPFTPDFYRMDDVYEQVCKDTQGYYVVGMKPLQFFEDFMPWQETTQEEYRIKRPSAARLKNLRSMASARWESEMYPKFIDALSGWVVEGQASANRTINARKLLFLRSTAGDKDCNNLNIDVSTYFEQELPNTCKFSLQQTQEEFKLHASCDPFTHSHDEGSSNVCEEEEEDIDETEESGSESLRGPGERNVDAANKVRGQIAAYAGVALSMTPRTHLFSVIYVDTYARFIRWDRRGAVVTHRFDYVSHPEYVFEFYRRFGQLSLRERGFDPTYKVFDQDVPETALRAFNKYLEDAWDGGVPLEELLYSREKSAKERSKNRFYLVEVKDTKTRQPETFLVPEPQFHVRFYNPFNRATRRSMAYPYKLHAPATTSSDDMCFIKDSWQEAASHTPREAEIYRRLKEHDVKHVASMRLGGDVEGLVTKTQDYFNDFDHTDRFSSLGQMICHRIILETVARDLSTFGWTKVLLSCVADAVEACQQAYKVGILHRDISAGNVMIARNKHTGEWKGLLIDWDMCILLDSYYIKSNDHRSGRTGTWAFLSANLLSGSDHTLADDLESFFWVIVYISLRYLRHNLSSNIEALSGTFIALFSFSNDIPGGKLARLYGCAGQDSYRSIAAFQPPEVNILINEMASVIVSHGYGSSTSETGASSCEDLNNPDNLWLSNILRKKAYAMAPMNITPTALKSPTNDSNPPSDVALWQSASREDAELEMEPNDIAAKTGLSPRAQTNAVKKLPLSFINHMDGISGHYHTSWRRGGSASTSTSKRQNKVEGDHERTDKGKKRRQV